MEGSPMKGENEPSAPPPIRDIVLYHYPMTRSARVRWLLLELGLDFRLERIDLIRGEGRSEHFLEKNPNHAVPVLEFVDGTSGEEVTMVESGAMVQFLAELFPQSGLAPVAGSAPSERAKYQQWTFFAAGWMDQILWQIRLHNDGLLPEGVRSKEFVEWNKNKFRDEIIPQVRAELEKEKKYILGDQFSSVDVLMAHLLSWASRYGLCEGEPLISEYLERIKARPSYQKAFDDLAEFGK